MNLKIKIIAAIIFLAFAGWAGLRVWDCYKMDLDVQKRSSWQITPTVSSGDVREVGYILDRRVMRDFSDKKKTIRWWVKMPSTNKVYSVSWESGYHDFIKDDGVELIRTSKASDDEDWDGTGYIIGLHDERKGKLAEVWVIDVDDLETDLL